MKTVKQHMLDPCDGPPFPPKNSGILTFTRPRCPVAAMYGQSPGPIYKLPGLMGQPDHDPRSVHTRGPAHILASRTFQKLDNCSPGPIYLPPAKMLRNGLDGPPEYTMAQRFKDTSVHCSPGPAAYLPKWTDCDKNFSFGLKQRNTDFSGSPGPAAYAVPGLVGCHNLPNKTSAPCFSMGVRFGAESLNQNPGPGSYKVIDMCHYKGCPPKYSLASRCAPPSERGLRPGPGQHCPEKVRSTRREPPHFSFGVRHSQYVGQISSRGEDCNNPCTVPLIN